MPDEKEPEINMDIESIKLDPSVQPRKLKGEWKAHTYLMGEEPPIDPNEKHPQPVEYYRHRQGKKFEGTGRQSFCVVEMLPFLKGLPLNDLTWNWITALRPSWVRVSDDGEVTCDAQNWRVTVYLNGKTKLIDKIEQEVSVGCVGVHHGHDLSLKTKALHK